MRWMRGVFVGKLDRTDEFLLLTPAGAMKTRCVRRLEGDNAWDLQFLNLCVGSPWNETARSTQQTPTVQQKDELESADVRTECICDRTFWTSTDVLQDAQVVLESGSTQECRARIEQEIVNKGDAIKLETSGNLEEIVPEPDCQFSKNRKVGEPDIHPGGASSLTADTPKRENLSKDTVRMRIYWRGALRLSTTFCVTRQLSTSAEIALR